MVTAYIALGSNIGDRLGNLSRAVDAIAHLPLTHVCEVSHAYETEPAYREDQHPFLNGVIEVETKLEADALLGELQEIEASMGRIRAEENGPRVIDLDLLLYGSDEQVSADLTLPHPRMGEREFVVIPLLEIAPDVEMPDGSRLDRAQATVGRVIRDHGRIPDAGLAHNMPIEETDWVAVARSDGPQTALSGFDAGLEIKRQALEQDGIPHAYEPFEPGLDVDFLGRPRVFTLVVPELYAQRARELLEDIVAAEPDGWTES